MVGHEELSTVEIVVSTCPTVEPGRPKDTEWGQPWSNLILVNKNLVLNQSFGRQISPCPLISNHVHNLLCQWAAS